MTKVLFVCLGNICRSPTAHGVFESMVRDRGVEHQISVDSAGTGAWHVGELPDPRARNKAKDRGHDLSHIRARQVDQSDFHDFDYILAMDHSNLSNLKAACPESKQHKLSLFLDFTELPESEVPDPYYGGDQGFDHVLDLVESASEGLLNHILSQG